MAYRKDLQDEAQFLKVNTEQCKTLSFQNGKTAQMQSVAKGNGILGLLISSGHLCISKEFSGQTFITAAIWQPGKLRPKTAALTCAESCNESVAEPELGGRDSCILVPLSDHLMPEPGPAKDTAKLLSRMTPYQ